MNKKGFVFLETIITIVVLATTLVFLYSNFNKVLTNEKERLYYDDTAYLYKTIMIRDVILNSVDESKLRALAEADNDFSLKNNLVMLIGSETPVYDNALLDKLYNLHEWWFLAFVNIDDISTIKKCINGETLEGNNISRCENFKSKLDEYNQVGNNFYDYLKTLDISDIDYETDNIPTSIIISAFYETKDGKQQLESKHTYNDCIKDKLEENGISEDEYKKDDSINYSMACQNAYYYSWIYYR